jgi:hypothetical protein
MGLGIHREKMCGWGKMIPHHALFCFKALLGKSAGAKSRAESQMLLTIFWPLGIIHCDAFIRRAFSFSALSKRAQKKIKNL